MGELKSIDRELFLDRLERSCNREIEPAATRIETSNAFPHGLYTRLSDLGVLSLFLPSQDDRTSTQFRLMLLAPERIARANIGFAVTVSNAGDCR